MQQLVHLLHDKINPLWLDGLTWFSLLISGEATEMAFVISVEVKKLLFETHDPPHFVIYVTSLADSKLANHVHVIVNVFS